jgi:tetratricopeptide (TPR) repeat protein
VRSLLCEASDIGIVATDCDPPRFSHPLIREALHGEVGELESARMHQCIGEVLEEIHAADLTSHCAAGAAAKVFAYQQGLNFSETALRLMEKRGAPATKCAHQLLQIAAFASAVNFQIAIDYIEKAAKLFEEADDLEGSAQADVQIGRLLTNPNHVGASTPTMNIDRAFIHYAAAQKALRDRPASEAIAGLYCGIAYASCEAARTTGAVAAARQAVAIAEQVGREMVWHQATGALAFALNASGRVSESFTIIERMRERAQLSGDPAILWEAAHNTAFTSSTAETGRAQHNGSSALYPCP